MDRAAQAQLDVLIALSASVALALSGCASALPVVTLLEAPRAPRDEADAALTLDAVEGRAAGLTLRAWARDARAGDTLELWRSGATQEALARLQSVVLSAAQADALRGREGLLIFDPELGAEQGARYELRVASASVRLTILTPPAPEAVEGLEGALLMAGARGATILLRWQAQPGHSALVLRRDVLAEAPAQRLTTLAPGARGVYLDAQTREGAIYAYRIAHAVTFGQGALYWGAPSEEIYVVASPPTPEPEPAIEPELEAETDLSPAPELAPTP